MKKCLMFLAIVVVLIAAQTVLAEAPTCNANQSWVVPPDGAVATFRTTDRTFAVGANSGGAHVPPRPGGERYPAPGGCDTFPGQCVFNQTTCSAGCISSPIFYCDICSCWSHEFPDC